MPGVECLLSGVRSWLLKKSNLYSMSKNPQKDVNTVMDDLCYEGELREKIIKQIVQ